MKRLFLKIGKIVFSSILALLCLWVAWVIWENMNGDAYRDAQDECGNEKVLIGEFRDYFHARQHYPAMTLQQLRDRQIISDDTFHFITDGLYGEYRYIPFSPDTRDDAPVLRLGFPIIGEWLYKGDLTAAQSAPDTVIVK